MRPSTTLRQQANVSQTECHTKHKSSKAFFEKTPKKGLGSSLKPDGKSTTTTEYNSSIRVTFQDSACLACGPKLCLEKFLAKTLVTSNHNNNPVHAHFPLKHAHDIELFKVEVGHQTSMWSMNHTSQVNCGSKQTMDGSTKAQVLNCIISKSCVFFSF